MKKKALVLSVLFAGLILSSIFLLYNETDKVTLNNQYQYKLDYYSGSYLYQIYSYEEYLIVTKNTFVQCIQAPCNPITDSTYKVAFKNKSMKKVQSFFDSLFQNSDSNYITGLQEEDITSDEELLLRGIINNNDKIFQKKKFNFDTYEVIHTDYYGSNSTRGYHINEDGTITISMGSKNTGGYSIGILKVTLKSNHLSIFVKEIGPKSGEVVSQAFTTPSITISSKYRFQTISVHNTLGNKFDEI